MLSRQKPAAADHPKFFAIHAEPNPLAVQVGDDNLPVTQGVNCWLYWWQCRQCQNRGDGSAAVHLLALCFSIR